MLPLFDSGGADGLLFYAMPYVEGESLRARLQRERQLPVKEAVRLAVAVAGELDYAPSRAELRGCVWTTGGEPGSADNHPISVTS
jgi:hypothetical protein